MIILNCSHIFLLTLSLHVTVPSVSRRRPQHRLSSLGFLHCPLLGDSPLTHLVSHRFSGAVRGVRLTRGCGHCPCPMPSTLSDSAPAQHSAHQGWSMGASHTHTGQIPMADILDSVCFRTHKGDCSLMTMNLGEWAETCQSSHRISGQGPHFQPSLAP